MTITACSIGGIGTILVESRWALGSACVVEEELRSD